ncbi:MAG: hypothetical protein ACI8ZM_004639 [Crocinitomix sp.]|jgi:hypothetical protein
MNKKKRADIEINFAENISSSDKMDTIKSIERHGLIVDMSTQSQLPSNSVELSLGIISTVVELHAVKSTIDSFVKEVDKATFNALTPPIKDATIQVESDPNIQLETNIQENDDGPDKYLSCFVGLKGKEPLFLFFYKSSLREIYAQGNDNIFFWIQSHCDFTNHPFICREISVTSTSELNVIYIANNITVLKWTFN